MSTENSAEEKAKTTNSTDFIAPFWDLARYSSRMILGTAEASIKAFGAMNDVLLDSQYNKGTTERFVDGFTAGNEAFFSGMSETSSKAADSVKSK